MNAVVATTVNLTCNNCMKTRFTQWVEAYGQELYRFALRLAREPHLAEDLVQETWLRAWRYIDRLQNEQSARAWLFSILHRENARRHSNTKAMEVNGDTTLDTIQDVSPQPDQKVLMRDVFTLLPESYRSVLILQAQGGYSCREIAELLELSPNAVMVRLSRARALIKAAFQSK